MGTVLVAALGGRRVIGPRAVRRTRAERPRSRVGVSPLAGAPRCARKCCDTLSPVGRIGRRAVLARCHVLAPRASWGPGAQPQNALWRCGVSIPVPLACKASDLPIDLHPHFRKAQGARAVLNPKTFGGATPLTQIILASNYTSRRTGHSSHLTEVS